MPDHHPPEELLMSYAAGVATEAHGLLCAVHLTLCPTCRDDVAVFEEIGGALLESAPGVAPVPPPSLPAPTTSSSAVAEGNLPDGAEGWPLPLHPYVRGRRWSWHSPGIHVLTTALRLEEMPVRLFRLAAGQRVPRHTHQGSELSLVLSGGFVDLGEHFVRGDVACRESDVSHDLVVDPDGECVTLAVNEHPLVPLTLVGKLYSVIRKP